MVGIKTTGEQISILCHNGTIFDKPREKDTLESERITRRTRFGAKRPGFPCGTPGVTGTVLDVTPSITTVRVLSVKNA
jgi:hypothetical protein